jgi:predicted translin family RNA/ssDNA-binding protein
MTTGNPYIPLFTTIQTDLDAHHAQRDSIIKASRDITSGAKKLIFALHRSGATASAPHAATLAPLYGSVRSGLQAARAHMPHVMDAWRYRGQMAAGVQELVEALLFRAWVAEGGRVLGLGETEAALHDVLCGREAGLAGQEEEEERSVLKTVLTVEDYTLGLMDLTGEIMRHCVTALARNGRDGGGGVEASVKAGLGTLREIQAGISMLSTSRNSFSSELRRKLEVLDGSVAKVENALYSLAVRKAERVYLQP